jgi:hypothetical protein
MNEIFRMAARQAAAALNVDRPANEFFVLAICHLCRLPVMLMSCLGLRRASCPSYIRVAGPTNHVGIFRASIFAGIMCINDLR